MMNDLDRNCLFQYLGQGHYNMGLYLSQGHYTLKVILYTKSLQGQASLYLLVMPKSWQHHQVQSHHTLW